MTVPAPLLLLALLRIADGEVAPTEFDRVQRVLAPRGPLRPLPLLHALGRVLVERLEPRRARSPELNEPAASLASVGKEAAEFIDAVARLSGVDTVTRDIEVAGLDDRPFEARRSLYIG